MLSRILFFTLLLILTVEIYSCNYNFNLPVTSYGDFSAAEKITLSTPKKSVIQTRLTSVVETKNTLLFVGDIMLARNVEYLMDKNGNDYPFLGLSFKDFDDNPLVVGNFESSVPEQHLRTKEDQLKFSVNNLYLPGLKRGGFTHLSLANNHSYDFAEHGFENTKSELSENNLTSFGDYRDFSKDAVSFVNIKDKPVALIGVHALQKIPTDEELFSVLNYAEKNSEFQIVYVHWGVEYEQESSTAQKELATRFVKAGADLIIGHHPHIVQEVDYIDGVLVFYSLGNYIFDQYFSKSVQNGLLLHLDLAKNKSISLIPITSLNSLSQPTYMTIKEHANFLSVLADKSHGKLKSYIKEGIIPLNIDVASSSKIAIIKI